MQVVDIAVALIVSGPNVRIDETDLGGLADSIRDLGLQQPITVTPDETGDGVECLFGHRRLAAARLAGLDSIPCIVRPRADPATRVLRQLAENTHRKDMSALELAKSYDELREAGLSQARISEAVGVTQTEVSRHLQLLRYPTIVQGSVHLKRVSLSDALGIPVELARRTEERDLMRILDRGGRAVRAWVRERAGVSAPSTRRGQRTAGARQVYSTLNLAAEVVDAVRDAAEAEGVSIAEWAERALRAALPVSV